MSHLLGKENEVITSEYKAKGGILTFDGEHVNGRGFTILRDLLVHHFETDEWAGFWKDPKALPIKPH